MLSWDCRSRRRRRSVHRPAATPAVQSAFVRLPGVCAPFTPFYGEHRSHCVRTPIIADISRNYRVQSIVRMTLVIVRALSGNFFSRGSVPLSGGASPSPLPSLLLEVGPFNPASGLGSAVSSRSRVPNGAPAEKRICWQ